MITYPEISSVHSMLFCQFLGRQSLRDLEVSFNSIQAHHYHLALMQSVVHRYRMRIKIGPWQFFKKRFLLTRKSARQLTKQRGRNLCCRVWLTW